MKYPAIDHLVVAASSLDEGTDYIFETLKVKSQIGGVHREMGTHNRLLKLGRDCYLEVIAINPRAQNPERPRWFELDMHSMQEKLRKSPRLITWAVRTDRIEKLSQRSTYPLGNVTRINRGSLSWRLTLTDDGHLPEGGFVPFLIQWDLDAHPVSALLQESRCRLVELHGYHAHPDSITHILESFGADHLIRMKQVELGAEAYLAAAIDTPSGVKMLV